MKSYTKVNLKTDVDDAARAFGMSPNLEFRVAGPVLEADESALSYLRIAPGFRLPFGHSHARQEELYLVVAGSAWLKLDAEVLEIGPWDCVRIARDTVRNLEGGPEGAELILVGAPRTGSGDAQMIQDWWPAS